MVVMLVDLIYNIILVVSEELVMSDVLRNMDFIPKEQLITYKGTMTGFVL